MFTALNICTSVWLAGWAGYAVRSLAKGQHHSVNFIIVLHFLYLGLAPLFDVFVGLPEFVIFPGFYNAIRDTQTLVITSLYVCACPPLWWWLGRSRAQAGERPRDLARFLYTPALRAAAWCAFLIPPFLVLTAPEPGLYAHYAANLDPEFQASESINFWDALVQIFALGCILAAALLLLSPGAGAGTLALVAAGLFTAGYFEGKRWFVAESILLLIYALWRRGVLRGVWLYAAGAAGVGALAVFSTWYQGTYREHIIKEGDEAFEHARLDYCRDHCVKLTIYAELHPEEGRILEYRGESVAFMVAMFVPRSWWPTKPWPYGVYTTARALDMPEPDYVGYGLTSTILEEAIANCSWLGLLVGPLVIAWTCRSGDSCGNALAQLVTIVLSILLLSVESQSFIMAIAVWTVLIAWVRWRGAVPDDRHLPGTAARGRPILAPGWPTVSHSQKTG